MCYNEIMKKFYAIKKNNEFIISGDELVHFNVLRCKIGEQILCLGYGEEDYLCEVVSVTKKEATAKILSTVKNTKNPAKSITVYQGLVKGEKADLIVQKLTELGVTKLIMFESEFTVAKANTNKTDRLNKISMEACKQCGRNMPLIISEPIKFNQMVDCLNKHDKILFANEKQTDRNLKEELQNAENIAIIVGSEGGFSDEEICKIKKTNAVEFGLGSRILRAETACIALASIVGYVAGV